jgi:hypothetical protein
VIFYFANSADRFCQLLGFAFVVLGSDAAIQYDHAASADGGIDRAQRRISGQLLLHLGLQILIVHGT